METIKNSLEIKNRLSALGVTRIDNEGFGSYLPEVGEFQGFDVVLSETTKKQIEAEKKVREANKEKSEEDIEILVKEELSTILPSAEEIPSYPYLTSSKGGKVTLGNLRLMGIELTDEMKLEDVRQFIKEKDGKWNLTSVISINPRISGGKHEIIADLLTNAKFTAKEIKVIVLPYKREGYKTEAEAFDGLRIKKGYKVTTVY